MKEEIKKITDSVKIGELSPELAKQQVLDLFAVINRIYLWIISFGILSDGLIGVITIGFIRTKIGLYSASKYAKWKHRVKYGL